MKKTPIDSKFAGQRNERYILSLLRERGEISQTQLCEILDLGSSTASSIVSRLRDKGLIIETQGISDRRGPKPVLLKINPQSRYVVGIEINPSYIYLGLFDFTANLITTQKLNLSANCSVDHVLEVIETNLPLLTGQFDVSDEKLLGVGITVSGSVSRQGVVQLSSTLGWKQVPLRELLEESCKHKILIYGTKVRLMAEIALLPELQSHNIVYINIANGVGATVYMDGSLMAGSTGRCGEIGHIITDPGGPVCGCGHKGCLEALISGRALAQRIQHDIAGGVETVLAGWLREKQILIPEDVAVLWGKALQQQDGYALQLRDYIADRLKHAVAGAVNSFDPDTVILAGYVFMQSPEFFTDSIRAAADAMVYDLQWRQLNILGARAGQDALIKGVAMAMLQDVHPI